MKISPSKVESFVRSVPPEIRVLLIYGPDKGLAKLRSDIISKNFLKSDYSNDSLVYIFDNMFKENKNIIMEKAFTNSLFGSSKKVIFIREAKDIYTNSLKEYLDKPDSETMIIAIAEDLSPSSSLRKLAESNNDHIASIACYLDTIESLRGFITGKLAQEGYKINNDALLYLCTNLGSDRAISNNEIDKIMLYKGDNKNISLEDVTSLVGDSSLIFIDKIHFSLFNLQIKDAYRYLLKILEDQNPVFVVRALANHLQRIHYVLSKPDQPIDTTIKEIRPLILFLYINKFKGQINLWNLEKAMRCSSLLIEMEIQVKLYPSIAESLVKQFFITFKDLFDNDFDITV